MNIGGGSGNATFAYGLIIVGIVIMVGLPLMINIFVPEQEVSPYSDVIDKLNEDYTNFTGSAPVKEDVWILSGIYLPYEAGGAMGRTSDGWLNGGQVHSYTPSQYSSGTTAYNVTDRPTVDGVTKDLEYYVYNTIGTSYTGIEQGDVYTSVAMDKDQKSNIFFTSSNKHLLGANFYYEYSGYRYAFKPLVNVVGLDDKGDEFTWLSASSSCSLIWYSYYSWSGLAGQLVVNWSGSDIDADKGTAYITAETIIQNFNSNNDTAKFNLQFNGVKMNLYIRMDSYYLSSGMSIADCFNNGYWSVMLTSDSADTTAYLATDYSFNPENIFNTVIDLLTFNMDAYGFTPFVAMLCSLIMVLPLYAGLIVIGLDNYPVLIMAGILLAIQTLVSTVGSWGL